MFTKNVKAGFSAPNLKGSADVGQIEDAIDLMKIKKERITEPMEVEEEEEIKSEKIELAKVKIDYANLEHKYLSSQKHVGITQKMSAEKLKGPIYKALPIPARPIPARSIPTRPITESKMLSLRPIGVVCSNIVKNVKKAIKSNMYCEVCNHIFLSKQRLGSHMSTHTHEKRYKCNFCDNAFARSDHLSNHVKNIHTHEKPYQCDLCPYKCAQKSSLTVHMRSHSKEKPYKCDTCGKVFSYKGSLNVHSKGHSNDRLSHRCKICGANFDYRSNLKRHVKTIHINVKTV